MDELEGKIQAVFRQTASELSLEPHKTIKLESSAQLGHFLRVTKKVGWGGEVVRRVWVEPPLCAGGEVPEGAEEVLCAGDKE